MSDDGFFSRWSRRKTEVRRGVPVAASAPAPAPVPATTAAISSATAAAPVPVRVREGVPAVPPVAPAASRPPTQVPEAPPLPTMDDVARLTRGSDFSRFVRAGVDEDVKRAALKKLFADPHFNVMDGLDVYIDDYGRPDPLPASMLRKMAQSKALGLFVDEKPAAAPPAATGPGVAVADASAAPTPAATAPAPPDPAPAPVAAAEACTDEDADLRLQPLDAAGREGAPRDAGVDAGRER